MSEATRVREVRSDDTSDWLAMRMALWPEGTLVEHQDEIRAFLAGQRPRGPWAVLMAEDGSGSCVGFAEVSVRPYAEGCSGTRVGYLEGWFVRPDVRGTGVGRALVAAAEAWTREQGCTELASDADPENGVSRAAHVALGFDDVGLVRCFRKEV